MTQQRLLELAERVEGASADQQRELLIDAYEMISRFGAPSYDWACRIMRFIEAEAYESAAMTLLDPTHRLRGFGEGKSGFWTADIAKRAHGHPCVAIGSAATPALALTAACLRALAHKDSDHG